ncbi:putative protein kinase [Cryptosporidium felis]|nr:putative protein kinase [Cryptosporidium felis]
MVKENASKTSDVGTEIYINENSKSHSINTQLNKNECKAIPKNSKSEGGESAFKTLANNFMSLFGYKDPVRVIDETLYLERSGRRRANFSKIEHSGYETVAVGTDIEDEGTLCRVGQIMGVPATTVSSSKIGTDDNGDPSKVSDRNKELGKLKDDSGDSLKMVSDAKCGNSHLPIIAHISGKPVHAKYSHGKSKIKVVHKNNELLELKLKPSEREGRIVSGLNFNSVVVPSPIIQFRKVPVQATNKQHQVVYNTPLITQRIVPHPSKVVYQPVYHHAQVDPGSNGVVGTAVGGMNDRTFHASDHPVENNYVLSGKVPNIFSNGIGSMNVQNTKLVGFGTPLPGYRSMSHVPNNHMNIMNYYQNEPGVEIVEAGQKTRLQSSNEVALSSNEHPRNGTGGSVTSVGSSGQMISSFKLGIPIKIKGQDDEGRGRIPLNTSKRTVQDSKQVINRTGNGNFQTLSLTTTASSDTGSATISNNPPNPKSNPEENSGLEPKSVKGSDEKGNNQSLSRGFISQASPVVNYRSTLDYLVTPMVRYRDVASNLKVKTIPPQLSSNEVCVNLEARRNSSLGQEIGSDSPRNVNMPSNDYKETVYIPVAPLPQSQPRQGVSEAVSTSGQYNCVPTIAGHNGGEVQGLKPSVFSLQGSNPVNVVAYPVTMGVAEKGLGRPALYKGIPVGVGAGGGVLQNSGYRLVRTSMRANVGVSRAVAGGASVYKENYVREENLNRNQSIQRAYVSKMYQYLADSSQFPPLPNEISLDEIEFLVRPRTIIASSGECKPLVSSTQNYETNVGLVKGHNPGKEMEWDSINRGTFCTVYKAKHGDGVAAVKCPQKKIHDSDPLMSRYRCYTEWKILHRCSRHPNILRLFGGIRINEYEIWLVTEYIRTGDLFKLIHGSGTRSRTFRDSVEHRYKVMYQLADSIRFLHSLSPKVVHKDLKSNNILVDEDYNIRICDFGDAEELRYNVITCCTAVTWQYAPPEIVGCSDPARPNSNANEKVDVWSMGCIFLEILTKKTPLQHILDNLEESSKHSTLYNLINSNKIEAELKIPPLPESLYNLITMCLKPNPVLRASSSEVFDYLLYNKKKILSQLSFVTQFKLNGANLATLEK